jgi:RNA polymerase sigma-70 factor (ECF subfamily)
MNLVSGMNSEKRYLATSPNVDHEALSREEDLLVAARGGSHAAFAQLQKIHSRHLYKRILSITRNQEDAEDALQDTFLSAYVALPSFQGRSKFSTWLMRIGINSALTILRRRRRRPEMPFEQDSNFEGDVTQVDVRDDSLNPQQLYDQQQRCHAIHCAIQRLDPRLRSAIGIWMSQDHSIKEMALDLGVSVPSVKARLYRARKRLLRSLSIPKHGTGAQLAS